MKEFIEKLIGRLEEENFNDIQIIVSGILEKYGFPKESIVQDEIWDALDELSTNKVVIPIVNELAEEHNGGWIPCSERLPDHMQTVLFTNEDGYVDCGWYDANENWCVNDNYFPNAFRFIAWQPLPDPYKEPERVDRN